MGQFGLNIAGGDLNFGTPVVVNLIETGINTGIFTAEFDIDDIITGAGVALADGDVMVISYNDLMDTPTESSANIVIGTPPPEDNTPPNVSITSAIDGNGD